MSGGDKKDILGIIGGVGPLACVYFADLIVRKTDADTDQNHIPFVLYNDTFIPDRTGYILGKTDISPLPELKKAIDVLQNTGCTLIALTCNTAHYFFNELQEYADVPVVNMIAEAVESAKMRVPDAKTIGVIATDGTIEADIYGKYIRNTGLSCVYPGEESRKKTMDIIYKQVKAGKNVNMYDFNSVVNELLKTGCDCVILGCTELSVINSDNGLTREYSYYTDAMEALAERCITLCGKNIK